MLVTTQSQKLPAHPFLEEAIKQFQEKIKIKVSWQEPRKLASQAVQDEGKRGVAS